MDGAFRKSRESDYPQSRKVTIHKGSDCGRYRCRALAYMRSEFQDEITGEKETVTAENGISLVATVDSQVVGIAEAIFLNQEQAKPESR